MSSSNHGRSYFAQPLRAAPHAHRIGALPTDRRNCHRYLLARKQSPHVARQYYVEANNVTWTSENAITCIRTTNSYCYAI